MYKNDKKGEKMVGGMKLVYKKIIWTVVMMVFICSLFCGCSKEKSSESDVSAVQKENVNRESESVNTGSTSKKQATVTEEMPIPKNKKEEEELFGKRDKSGKFIPPEGAYKDSNGYTYNKYGVVIDGPIRIIPGAKG